MENIDKLVLGDCFNEIDKLPEKIVDMVICDLPYNCTNNFWDKNEFDIKLLWEKINRITKVNNKR